MKKISLVSFAVLFLLVGAHVLEGQDYYTAQVYYADGGSDTIYDFRFYDNLTGVLLYDNNDTEYNVGFSTVKTIEFLAYEPYTWPDGERGYISTMRITFRNGDAGVLYAYDTEDNPAYFSGNYVSPPESAYDYWFEYAADIVAIEFY